MDAGGGKYLDPNQGWTYNAQPLPALDTYTRHTIGAQYIYEILGPQGLRFMTPLVVYVELLCTPVALLASFLGSDSLLNFAIGMICQLHIGISISIRNAVLLSFVACSVWCVFLPVGWKDAAKAKKHPRATASSLGLVISTLLVVGAVATTGSLPAGAARKTVQALAALRRLAALNPLHGRA